MEDENQEHVFAYLKGLPPNNTDPVSRYYTDEFKNIFPATLQNLCLTKILFFENEILEIALTCLPLKLSEEVKALLQKICCSLIYQTKGCWSCSGKKECLICDRAEKYLRIQRKHKAHVFKERKNELSKSEVNKERKNELSISTAANQTLFEERIVSNRNYIKLIFLGLEHQTEHKWIQKLLRDLLYDRFFQVSIHYICIIHGDWDRFRERTKDKAVVVLTGSDYQKAGTYLIHLFKNPIFKDIRLVPAKHQRLYPNETEGGFHERVGGY